MNHDHYPDDYLRDILSNAKSIAVLGASDDPARASNEVLGYLLNHDYRLFTVNPKLAGQSILGVPVYASLADIPEPIDLVDVFRNSSALPGIVDEVLALPRLPGVFWTQLDVRDDEAAAKAEAVGIKVIMDRCTKIEINRLL